MQRNESKSEPNDRDNEIFAALKYGNIDDENLVTVGVCEYATNGQDVKVLNKIANLGRINNLLKELFIDDKADIATNIMKIKGLEVHEFILDNFKDDSSLPFSCFAILDRDKLAALYITRVLKNINYPIKNDMIATLILGVDRSKMFDNFRTALSAQLKGNFTITYDDSKKSLAFDVSGLDYNVIQEVEKYYFQIIALIAKREAINLIYKNLSPEDKASQECGFDKILDTPNLTGNILSYLPSNNDEHFTNKTANPFFIQRLVKHHNAVKSSRHLDNDWSPQRDKEIVERERLPTLQAKREKLLVEIETLDEFSNSIKIALGKIPHCSYRDWSGVPCSVTFTAISSLLIIISACLLGLGNNKKDELENDLAHSNLRNVTNCATDFDEIYPICKDIHTANGMLFAGVIGIGISGVLLACAIYFLLEKLLNSPAKPCRCCGPVEKRFCNQSATSLKNESINQAFDALHDSKVDDSSISVNSNIPNLLYNISRSKETRENELLAVNNEINRLESLYPVKSNKERTVLDINDDDEPSEPKYNSSSSSSALFGSSSAAAAAAAAASDEQKGNGRDESNTRTPLLIAAFRSQYTV